MEVLTFITSNKYLIDKFSSFLQSYSKLHFSNKDNDTYFYINPKTGKNEIYFHFVPTNLEKEFMYNYNEEEQKEIENYFGNNKLILFDIQFKNEIFLQQLLIDFNDFLNSSSTKDILLSHPSKGVLRFDDFINL